MSVGNPAASSLVPFMLFGWPFILTALFLVMPSHRAVIGGFVFAWLFLPIAEYQIIGLPEYDKKLATCVGAFIATCVFDPNRILSFRSKWVDLPMLLFCACPIASSLTNGLGLYDGLSEMIRQIMRWGLPYFLGRVYFTDLRNMRELAIGVLIGGIAYLPLCWYEIRFSPQLHIMFYGYYQHAWGQTVRLGGWRPMVFLEHGLMVGMWMTTASLVALALWLSGSLRSYRNVPTWPIVLLLAATTILCKSMGSILLLFLGGAVILAAHYLRTSLPIMGLSLIPVIYITLRAPGIWYAQELPDVVSPVFGPDRAASLQFRIMNENMLTARAMQQPFFGWGGWGRSRIGDAEGRDISITDSQWIITFGLTGGLGLSMFLVSLIVPIVLLPWRAPPRLWRHPLLAGPVMLAVILALWMIDNTVNAMFNPVYLLFAGGLAGMKPVTAQQLSAPHVLAAVSRHRAAIAPGRASVPGPGRVA